MPSELVAGRRMFGDSGPRPFQMKQQQPNAPDTLDARFANLDLGIGFS